VDDARLKTILEAGAAKLGLTLDTRQVAQLLTLTRELLDWSARFNLTAIRAPEDVVRKHLLDSLTVLPHLHGERIADVGSGAGFPGLPLAIAAPRLRFTLIEATGKKVRFIEHAVAQLGLTNVAVVHARAEAFKPPSRFDAAVARALSSLAEFIRVAGHLCTPEGRLLAMKGQLPNTELADLPKGWRVLRTHALEVPGLDAARHLVILQRAADSRARSR
jgi:16S rRNA (guanine527-N7)-methyltransferase